MQSRVHHEHHQRRQAAARIEGTADARAAFLNGLLSDALLLQDARRSFLAFAQRAGITGPLLDLAAEEADSVLPRAAFRRLDDLLEWQERRAPLAGWWGQQALFEYNNDGRRHAEQRVGYRRGTGETIRLVSDHQPDVLGVLQPLPLADETADPADRYERTNASADIAALLAHAEGHHALAWLREWVDADALHADTPVMFEGGAARLAWRYRAQTELARRLGVTTRTLRNRTGAVEALLLTLSRVAHGRPAAVPATDLALAGD